MEKSRLIVCVFILSFLFTKSKADNLPETVKTGIYITSIHDIDFRQKEYSINFWVWFNYKTADFNFVKYLEIPQAKSVKVLYSADSLIVDTTTGDSAHYVLLKLQCVMKDSWKIVNFPFNHQSLRFSIENAQYDSTQLVFAKDTLGKSFDPHALMDYGTDSLRGWHINPDSVKITIGTKEYETTFGDPTVSDPHGVYSAYKVKIGISRNAWGLFWKIFLGMYVSFLIAYATFYIHSDSIEARFGLTVGALFAVIGNKYVIESSLPESSIFTLVDALHGVTLIFILCVVVATTVVLKLNKEGKTKRSAKFDLITPQILLVIYLLLNFYFISKAIS